MGEKLDMALFQRKVGRHLSDGARKAINDARSYAVGDEIRNPLIRRLARRIAAREWEARLADIDFPYEMRDVVVGEVPCVAYSAGKEKPDAPLVLYLHGGGFISGSPRSNAAAVLPLCALAAAPGLGVRYSLSPESVFPTALEEVETVYRALLTERRPDSIALVGDSAGANLALASLVRWREKAVPLPACAVLYSPYIDAAATSDTMQTLKHHDPLVGAKVVARIEKLYRFYAPNLDVLHPHVSPLYADLAGLPPLLIHVGSRETLLGEAARLADKARRAGVDAALHVFDGMFHLFHMHWRLDEAKRAQEEAAAFVAKHAG